jgi:hypothetical protein
LNRELDRDTNCKTVAKLIERKGKRKKKHCKRKSGGLCQVAILFKDQFISCKAGKIWAVLREELGWLAGLINTAFSCNMVFSAPVVMLISTIVCMRCDQYS